jgi:hypothetical protein
MIERVAANAVMHLELGPKTRETIKAVLPVPTDSNKKEGVAGVLRKGADAARGKSRLAAPVPNPGDTIRLRPGTHV